MTHVPASLLALLATVGTAAAQPVFTQLPAANSLQIIGLDVSDDGRVVCGFVAGNTSFIWRADALPQIETITSFSANGGESGPLGSIDAVDASGNRFLLAYRDHTISPDTIYLGGLANATIFENGVFTVIPPPPIAAKCDQSIVSPNDISGDGLTVMAMPWRNCRVAPYAWRADTGWTPWATLPIFPAFGQSGYESHKVEKISRNGSMGGGWYQSGTGYGGRTALVWTDNGQTLHRMDEAPHSVLWGQITAVSDNGRYAAGSGIPDNRLPEGEVSSAGNKYIYRWSLAGGTEVLGKVETMPGSIFRKPNIAAISNNGRIVVGQDSFGFDREAFVWTPEGGGQKLTDYVAARGLNLPGDLFVTLTSAAGMSPDGRYIVGQWQDLGGSVGPYLLDMGPQPCNQADVGGQGGAPTPDYALDNNDFVVFIDLFFSSSPAADLGSQGGVPGADTQFDNNDFIVFIDYFFAGC